MALRASALALVALLSAAPGAVALSLRGEAEGAAPASNATAPLAMGKEVLEGMSVTPHNFMEVTLGPFASAVATCDYCFSSFTKAGQSPAGPIAPACVCMAYPDGAAFNMFCATPVSAAGYVASKGGCRCKGRDMEHMAATTCEPIS
mmetsp:Transcript_177004/g.567616  ORF Transcript_177004/g.567616 Transcript_177004/m.567616 type:complete len:147 (+) Transcript_177004:187-627(+)